MLYFDVISAILAALNSQLAAALLGAIVGGIIAIVAGVYSVKYQIKSANKKLHYDEIKLHCLLPLQDKLYFIRTNEFGFGWASTDMALPARKVVICYNELLSGVTTSKHKYKYMRFSFKNDTENLDRPYYDDLDAHFPSLVKRLSKCEEFIYTKVPNAEERLFDLCEFLYKNRKYQNFVKSIVTKNPKVPNETIEKDYFIFGMLALPTSHDTEAKKYLPSVLIYGGVDECLRILKPYLGDDFHPKEGNIKINELWKIYKNGRIEITNTLDEIGQIYRGLTLPGDCSYL